MPCDGINVAEIMASASAPRAQSRRPGGGGPSHPAGPFPVRRHLHAATLLLVSTSTPSGWTLNWNSTLRARFSLRVLSHMFFVTAIGADHAPHSDGQRCMQSIAVSPLPSTTTLHLPCDRAHHGFTKAMICLVSDKERQRRALGVFVQSTARRRIGPDAEEHGSKFFSRSSSCTSRPTSVLV